MFHNAPSSLPRQPRRAGFTLLELLVVVLIIALLIAIIVPSIAHFKKVAKSGAVAMQLSGLQNALENYYADFNTYPPSNNGANPPGTAYGTAIAVNRGPAFLAQGLMGYLTAGLDGGGSNGAQPIAPDPPYGFRVKGTGVNATGKLYAPYADPGALVDHNPGPETDATLNTDQSFADSLGTEIFYFRSTRTANDVTGFSSIHHIFGDVTSGTADYYFEATDNLSKPAPAFGHYDNGIVDSATHLAEIIPAPNQTPPAHSVADFAAFYKLLGATGTVTASIAPNDTGGANVISGGGGAVPGSGSYLLIGLGPDGKPYSGDDVIVGGK